MRGSQTEVLLKAMSRSWNEPRGSKAEVLFSFLKARSRPWNEPVGREPK